MTVIYIERKIIYVIGAVSPATSQLQHQHHWRKRWLTLITELQFKVLLRDLGIWVCVALTQTTHLNMAADQQPTQWQWRTKNRRYRLPAGGKWRRAQNIDLDTDLLQKSESQIPQDPSRAPVSLSQEFRALASGVFNVFWIIIGLGKQSYHIKSTAKTRLIFVHYCFGFSICFVFFFFI